MNKKTKFKLNETLDKALAPPKKVKNLKALDSLLDEFNDGKDLPNFPTQTKPRPDRTQTRVRPDTDPTQTSNDTNKYSVPTNNLKLAKTPRQNNISPVRDFNKRANSLERDALPAGLFPGASKAIYDALYIRTIGAIEPKRTVQVTRKVLMEWTGIKNIKTVNTHLKKLKDEGLVKVTNFVGEQKGSYYEVLLPEEITQTRPNPTQTQPKPNSDQKLGLVPDQKLVWVGLGETVDNIHTYSFPKTSLKTLSNDDEQTVAFADFIKEISEASIRITGKKVKKSERAKWREVAELLVMELELAAARTEAVSSVPAFLKEVLRRKLETRSSAVKKVDSKVSQSLKVGKSSESEETFETWEKQPLGKEEKERTVQIMRERIEEGHDELVMSMKQTYTEEDWKWLMEKIDKA
jgi:DNA-binding transcriptional ArsR family regulator